MIMENSRCHTSYLLIHPCWYLKLSISDAEDNMTEQLSVGCGAFNNETN